VVQFARVDTRFLALRTRAECHGQRIPVEPRCASIWLLRGQDEPSVVPTSRLLEGFTRELMPNLLLHSGAGKKSAPAGSASGALPTLCTGGPATSYFPTGLPLQYRRGWRA
jgi:hypothetical protein